MSKIILDENNNMTDKYFMENFTGLLYTYEHNFDNLDKFAEQYKLSNKQKVFIHEYVNLQLVK